MSLDPRSFFPNDADDTQLPPLLPPISSTASIRPPPLEPSAQTDDDNLHSVKFTNLEAKSLGQVAPPTKEAATLPAYVDPADLKNRSSKWAKSDFYQLPKPSTSSLPAGAATASLPPILLNDLHQPPPSAARFPPITGKEGNERSQDTLPSKPDSSENVFSLNKKTDGTNVDTNWRKQKRVLSRGRVQWTEAEVADLLKGVKSYGLGRWRQILNDSDLHFNVRRTASDLKDRYRTCRLAQDRVNKELVESKKPTVEAGSAQLQDTPLSQKPAKPVFKSRKKDPSHESSVASSKSSQPGESELLELKFENYSLDDFKARNEPSLPTFDPSNLARFARWPPIDDERLERGFRKYGFRWSLIASDPDIGLMHRTAHQIRDRFRIRFPRNYKDSNPMLPVSTANTETDAQDPSSKASDNTSKARVTRNPGWPELDDLTDDNALTLPPLNRDFWKTVQSQDAAVPSTSAAAAKQSSTSHANDTANWLQLGNQEMNLDYEDARGINIDSLDDDLDFGGPLAPLRYPYDQDWAEDGFDSSLQLPPMILFPPEADDA